MPVEGEEDQRMMWPPVLQPGSFFLAGQVQSEHLHFMGGAGSCSGAAGLTRTSTGKPAERTLFFFKSHALRMPRKANSLWMWAVGSCLPAAAWTWNISPSTAKNCGPFSGLVQLAGAPVWSRRQGKEQPSAEGQGRCWAS